MRYLGPIEETEPKYIGPLESINPARTIMVPGALGFRSPAMIEEIKKVESKQAKSPLTGLWDQPGEPKLGEVINWLVPFKEQIEGTKEFFTEDTAMEIASLYAAGKVIPTISRPIANKIRKLFKLPLKPDYVPQMNRFLNPSEVENIKTWVENIPEKTPEPKVEAKPETKPKPTPKAELKPEITPDVATPQEYLDLEKAYTEALAEEPIDLEKVKSLRHTMASIMPEEMKATPEQLAEISALREKPPTGTILQSTVIPGAKEFYEKDIVPKAIQLGQGLKDTWQRLKNLVVPRAGVRRDILDKIMAMKGERDKAEFVLEQTNKKVRNFFDKLPQSENIAFMDRLKKGEDQPNPVLQQIADMIRGMDDDLGKELLKYKPDMKWIEDHFRILYKVIPGTKEEGFRGLFRRPLEGTKGFFKQHTLADLSEGLAKGGIPYTYNPMRMFEMHYADAMKYITAQKMWQGLEDIGGREFVRFGHKPPINFVRLNDRIAKIYFHVPQGLVNAGEWYVDEGAGRLLNNFLSRDLIRENATGRGLMWIKNSTTAAELSFNAFHAMFETVETVSSGAALGARKIWNTGILEKNWKAIGSGFKDIITAPFTPFETARLGGSAVKYITNKYEFLNTFRGQEFIKKFPDAETLINDLFTGGGKLAMSQDYKINSIQTFRNALIENNYIGAAIRSIPALNETMMKPLFEIYIPRLKVGMFLKEYSSMLAERAGDITSGKITKPELARTVWDFVENRLGEMNFDNLFWDRTFKTSLQAVIRSVTWKMGNIRAFGNAISRQAIEFASAAKEGRIPRLEQEMAWVWGLAATTGAMASTIMYLATGKMPTELIDFVYPKVDQEGNRISLPTYMRDLFSIAHSPLQYVGHSMAGWVSRFGEVIQNKDFYGVEVHDPDESWANQRIDDLIHMVPLPFAISSLERAKEERQSFERQISGFLGFTKAPFYIQNTKAEQLAAELMSGYMPERPRTKEEAQRSRIVKGHAIEIQKAIKEKTPLDEIVTRITEEIKGGKLNLDDIKRIQKRLREPLEARVERLTLSDAFKVWDIADEKEKERLKGIIAKKIRNLERSPDELKAMKGQLDKFLEDIKK